MEKKFKPMLAVNADRTKIKYPCLCSNKLDGIRCIFKGGQMLTRSLKQITSEPLQKRFEVLKGMTANGGLTFDGELYCHGMEFSEISHFVRKSDADVPMELKFHCFDVIIDSNYSDKFTYRKSSLEGIRNMNKDVVIVEQKEIGSEKELDKEFEISLKDGYEGLILRATDGPYKCGRSSVTEGYLLKVKPFLSFDAEIIDVIERMENLNESQTNELGRSFKRNTKDDKMGTGIAAVFKVMYEGKEMGVTITGDEEFRTEIWGNRKKYIGRMIEYKAMLVGAKDVPRHPNFMRFRDDRD